MAALYQAGPVIYLNDIDGNFDADGNIDDRDELEMSIDSTSVFDSDNDLALKSNRQVTNPTTDIPIEKSDSILVIEDILTHRKLSRVITDWFYLLKTFEYI